MPQPACQQNHNPAFIEALTYLEASKCTGLRGRRLPGRREIELIPDFFIPISRVKTLVLREDTTGVPAILRAIYPEGRSGIDINRLKERYQRVFCILIRLEKVHYIEHFMRNGLEDSKLPFDGPTPPYGFPGTKENTFYDAFRKEQQTFCAVEFEHRMDGCFNADRLLPITCMNVIKNGYSATVRQFRIHPDYDSLHMETSKVKVCISLIRLFGIWC